MGHKNDVFHWENTDCGTLKVLKILKGERFTCETWGILAKRTSISIGLESQYKSRRNPWRFKHHGRSRNRILSMVMYSIQSPYENGGKWKLNDLCVSVSVMQTHPLHHSLTIWCLAVKNCQIFDHMSFHTNSKGPYLQNKFALIQGLYLEIGANDSQRLVTHGWWLEVASWLFKHMGVSKNRGGPPKWMVYNGKPY